MRLIAIAITTLLAACTADQPAVYTPNTDVPVETETRTLPSRPLRLSRVPHISQEKTRVENEPLAAYLTKHLGNRVELVVPKDYDTVISELQSGEVDIAILAPLSYVVAKERMPQLTLVAQIVAEGGNQFLSYVVTKTDGPVQTLADLKGRKFAFVDKRSTTGYLLALDLLLASDVVPERDLKDVRFAGSHPEVVDLVLEGKVDAGAIASTTYGHMRDANLTERLRIVAKSEPVPFDAVVAQPSLPPELVAALRATLLELSTRTEEGRAVLSGMTLSNGFLPPNDPSYDNVRRIARKLDLLR